MSRVRGATFRGLAIPYGKVFDVGLAFLEQVHPGALAGASLQRVVFRTMHDPRSVVASVKAGSLRLRNTPGGLLYEVELVPSDRVTAELMARGDLGGVSPGFVVQRDEWTLDSQDRAVRTITQMRLLELSAVDNPAYATTSVEPVHGGQAAAPPVGAGRTLAERGPRLYAEQLCAHALARCNGNDEELRADLLARRMRRQADERLQRHERELAELRQGRR